MFAATLFMILTNPTVSEVKAPRGWELFGVCGVGPKGQVIIEAYKEERYGWLVWDGKKFAEITLAQAEDFGLDEEGVSGIDVAGFLPNGDFFGERFYTYSGASTIVYSRPFISRQGKFAPVSLPKDMSNWELLGVKAVRSDGAILLQGVRSDTHFIMGDEKKAIEKLMWVKDGKLIEDLGPASNPILLKDGRIIATQYVDADGDPTRSSTNWSKCYVVEINKGSTLRLTEGEAVAALSEGGIIVKTTGGMPDGSDRALAPVSFQSFKNGKLSPFTVPGAPESITDLMITPDGNGSLIGWNGEKPCLLLFDRNGSQQVPIPNAKGDVEFPMFNGDHFAFMVYDYDGAVGRLFVGRR